MKRALILLGVLALTLCPVLSAQAAGTASSGFVMPDSLKPTAALAENLQAPDSLPAPVTVTSFTIDNGLITVELSDEVPSLKITEMNFLDNKESTIFSKKNTSTAVTNRTGDEHSVFTVIMTWKFEDGTVFTREYNTWSGEMTFSRAMATGKVISDEFKKNWKSAERTLYFREDGLLRYEYWVLTARKSTFTKTTNYDEEGKLESCEVAWRATDFDGTVLEAEVAGDGTLLTLQSRNTKSNFTVRSISVNESEEALSAFRENSYDPDQFDRRILASYPVLAAELFGISYAAPQPSTQTDLPSTQTDLPAVEVTDPGEATENTRVWEIAFGDYFDSKIYVFASDDPLFFLEDRKAVTNTEAKDINGNAISFKSMPNVKSPAFDLPEIR